MTKQLLLFMAAVMLTFSGQACDVCGCSLSGLYFGFLPNQNAHFVGVKYSHASFSAFIDNDGYYFEDEYSEDTYQRYDLMGRFSLGDRFQVRYLMPYMINNMEGSHQTVHSEGFGDPMVILYYSPFNTGSDFSGAFMHSLSVGAGLKVPLGEFDKADNGELVNRNFQLGSGSLDYVLSANYTIRRGNMGVSSETSLKLNSTNAHAYRFGNQFNLSANTFYYFEMKKVSLVPFAGLYYEIADRHKNHQIIEANTGGSSLLSTFGVQLFAGRVTTSIQYQVPLMQAFNTDDFAEIEGGNRLTAGLYYSFSFKKNQM
ncbi:hypothetical protein [Marinoscillum sp.]|uniref:hypothetical protein n=1 Tax=Marinoscillum sp. TaxID=2024838 RepID=UPI003BAC9F47